MTAITFVNHASVIIEAGTIRLLSDPWIEGSTFHNGWELIAPTRFPYDDFRSVTHIWFSHEHPDHFFPPNLKKIPEDARRQITVLFQNTADKKVISFCSNLGFCVRELPERRWVNLAPRLRVMNGKVGFYDSWLMLETEDARILNLNDCQLNDVTALRALQNLIGSASIDLLLTQFSYASWFGDVEDKTARENAARKALDRLRIQSEVLGARHTLPFASFIYFAHRENYYLNDSINSVADAVDCIRRTRAAPIVMYPGDRWTIAESHDNSTSLARWSLDYADIPAKMRHQPARVPMKRLVSLSSDYLDRLWAKNNRILLYALSRIGFFPTIIIKITDLDKMLEFSVERGLREAANVHRPDIEMSSESLAFVLQFEYGMDTLNVNGRFRSDHARQLRVTRAFAVGVLNNTGRRLGFGMLMDWRFCVRALARLLRIKQFA